MNTLFFSNFFNKNFKRKEVNPMMTLCDRNGQNFYIEFLDHLHGKADYQINAYRDLKRINKIGWITVFSVGTQSDYEIAALEVVPEEHDQDIDRKLLGTMINLLKEKTLSKQIYVLPKDDEECHFFKRYGFFPKFDSGIFKMILNLNE